MATDNRPVTCYLPKDVEDFVTRYCTEYGITRKDKDGNIQPSLGTGIIELLKNLSLNPDSVPSPLSSIVPSRVSDSDMESKIRGILPSLLPSLLKDTLPSLLPSTETSKLPDDLITSEQLENAITEWRFAIESLRDELSGVGAMGDYLARLTAIENQISPIIDSQAEIEMLLGK